MIAAVIEFFFMFLPLIALGCLIPAFYYNDSRAYGASTVWFVIFAGLMSWANWDLISGIAKDYGIVFTVGVVAGTYIIAGVTTAFIYWFFFIFKARERFDYYMTKFDKFPLDESEGLANKAKWVNTSDSAKKYLIINNDAKLRHIFDNDSDITKNIKVARLSGNLTDAEYDTEVAKVLPPRFAVCKPNIIGAAIVWPVTLLWLLVSRVVKQLIERIISSFGGLFNAISSMAFGKF